MKDIERENAALEPFVFHRQIGSTLYKVGLYTNPDATEKLDDIIRRLLKNDLQNESDSSRMNTLQAARLSERSSS